MSLKSKFGLVTFPAALVFTPSVDQSLREKFSLQKTTTSLEDLEGSWKEVVPARKFWEQSQLCVLCLFKQNLWGCFRPWNLVQLQKPKKIVSVTLCFQLASSCKNSCTEFRNGASEADATVCIGPTEGSVLPCYPITGGQCDSDMSYCDSTATSEGKSFFVCRPRKRGFCSTSKINDSTLFSFCFILPSSPFMWENHTQVCRKLFWVTANKQRNLGTKDFSVSRAVRWKCFLFFKPKVISLKINMKWMLICPKSCWRCNW